jgi:hypothetical protein
MTERNPDAGERASHERDDQIKASSVEALGSVVTLAATVKIADIEAVTRVSTRQDTLCLCAVIPHQSIRRFTTIVNLTKKERIVRMLSDCKPTNMKGV